MLSYIRNRWHPFWRLRKTPVYRQFQRRFDFTVFKRIPGTGIRVALRFFRDSTWIAAPAVVEPGVRNAFLVVVDVFKPAVFWDVGANIGFYSWFLRQHPSTAQIVMLEPDPVNFALITRTISKNNISNCRPLNVALSDREGEASFLVDPASGTTGCLEAISHPGEEYSLHNAYGMNHPIMCRTNTMDGLIEEGLPAPDFIKIDVEGAEHLVLAGAATCLAQKRPLLIIETFDAAIVEKVESAGYVVLPIDGSNFLCVPAGLGDALALVEKSFPRRSREPGNRESRAGNSLIATPADPGA